eukprot:8563612-Pyramimonas_sp.AAC.1
MGSSTASLSGRVRMAASPVFRHAPHTPQWHGSHVIGSSAEGFSDSARMRPPAHSGTSRTRLR